MTRGSDMARPPHREAAGGGLAPAEGCDAGWTMPTPAQRRWMQSVLSRSKGWPVGIPVPQAIARRLVAKQLAEWAPPFWNYPQQVFSIRLTGWGEAVLRCAP